MADNKKPGKSSGTVDGIERTLGSRNVERAAAVGEVKKVQQVQGASAISGSSTVGKVRGTRLISMDEREQLLKMIEEEAQSLFGANDAAMAKVAQQAVKMAIDSTLLNQGEDMEEIELLVSDVKPEKPRP